MEATVKLRTYLVEDNPTIRENLIATLEELAQVETVGVADSELDGKTWLLNNPQAWDLAVVDLFLRQGSGIGVLESCARQSGNRHVVVLSNYATADIRTRCLELGANAVFDKSTDIDALVDYCVSLVSSKLNT